MESNNKSFEALADEALDKVAGGQEEYEGRIEGTVSLGVTLCFGCGRVLSEDEIDSHDGQYYCSFCHKQLMFM